MRIGAYLGDMPKWDARCAAILVAGDTSRV
jgi:hypothetical protein